MSLHKWLLSGCCFCDAENGRVSTSNALTDAAGIIFSSGMRAFTNGKTFSISMYSL